MEPFQNQRIHLVSDINECRRLLQILESHCDQEFPVLGFDCEWISQGKVRQPIAILQLASNRGLCILIQLCHMRTIPKELIDILENENIVKVGVESKRDADFLFEDYSIRVKSTLDLRYFAELVNCAPSGLAKMSEDFLNVKLNKKCWGIHLRWESLTLKPKEINYAAKDVQVAIELFKYFNNKLHADILQNQTLNIRDLIDKYCALYFDLRYNRGKQPENSNSAIQNPNSFDEI